MMIKKSIGERQLTCVDDHGFMSNAMTAAASAFATKLAAALRRNITVTWCHGRVAEPRHVKNEFFVFVSAQHSFMIPMLTKTTRVCGNMMVISSTKRWSRATEIKSPEGDVIACLDNDNVFLYYDALKDTRHVSHGADMHVADAVIRAFENAQASVANESLNEEIKARHLNDVVLKLKENNAVYTAELEEKIKSITSTLERLRKESLSNQVLQNNTMRELSAENTRRERLDEEAPAVVNELRSLPGVTGVHVARMNNDDTGLLVVTTEPLKVTTPDGLTRELGEFAIHIRISDCEFFVFNTRWQVTSDSSYFFQAPNVAMDGSILSWGPLASAIGAAMGKRDIIAIVKIVLNKLRSSPTDSQGIRIAMLFPTTEEAERGAFVSKHVFAPRPVTYYADQETLVPRPIVRSQPITSQENTPSAPSSDTAWQVVVEGRVVGFKINRDTPTVI